jgi:hypothetical protein
MKLLTGVLFVSLFATISSFAQELKTKNVIIVTLDGYRWKEVFKGADPTLLADPKSSPDLSLIASFQGENEFIRREKLMPFFWNEIAQRGQLYGNRNFRNKVNCYNDHLLSYPGYSEMLVGFPDKRIYSNKYIENPNPTVLEFIHEHPAFHQKVAAFATWEAFPLILRENKAKFYVNAGATIAQGKVSENEAQINKLLTEDPTRYDSYTFEYAFEYMKRERPRVMFISFEETDRRGHPGEYDQYLSAAHDADKRIGQIWQWVQSQPDYKDQTTLLITTDHGRGKAHNTWTNHRLLVSGSRHIWFAVIGPDTPALGELKFKGKYYQKQLAKTIAAFVGLNYVTAKPAGEIIQTMFGAPQTFNQEILSENFKDSTQSNNK